MRRPVDLPTVDGAGATATVGAMRPRTTRRRSSGSSISQRVGERAADVDLPVADMSLTYAVTATVVLLGLAAVAAGWRLQRFQLRGDE